MKIRCKHTFPVYYRFYTSYISGDVLFLCKVISSSVLSFFFCPLYQEMLYPSWPRQNSIVVHIWYTHSILLCVCMCVEKRNNHHWILMVFILAFYCHTWINAKIIQFFIVHIMCVCYCVRKTFFSLIHECRLFVVVFSVLLVQKAFFILKCENMSAL